MGFSDFSGNSNNNNTPPPSSNGGGSSIGRIFGSFGGPDMEDEPVDVLSLIINYNERFKTAGNTLYRDNLVQQTIAVLIGKNKPNPLLIGAAGVGKTKIVEDIAYRLANDDILIPDNLKGYTIYELPLAGLMAGSGLLGSLESKVKAIISFFEDKDNKAIMFIDEIHMIASNDSAYDKIAQILKPALARGDIKVIGATTLQESNDLNDDPAFNRRFSRLLVDELTRAQTIEILRHAAPSFVKHYNNKVVLPDDIFETVANVADQYGKAGSHRPDNALTLLDRAMGTAIVERHIMEENAKDDPALLAAIQSVPTIPLTAKQLKSTAMKLMTGHSKQESFDDDKLRKELSIIRGQDEVIEEVINIVERREKGLFPDEKTPLTMLFAGVSGVGKTELTKILANVMTKSKPIILNMTEYHSSASINRIIGAPAGYVGSDSHAELPFDALETNPYQIILLDEFEKCNKSVQRLFMSAFDEGYIKTNKGKTIDFSKSIIIATTNAAHESNSTGSIGFTDSSSGNKTRATVEKLSDYFDVALLNRFEHILTFNPISKEVYTDILAENYKSEIARIKANKRNIMLPAELPKDELAKLADETYVPEFGARPVKKTIRSYIESNT